MDDTLWRTYVRQIQARLAIKPSKKLLEVGCGAGAFLYPLYEQGIDITGIDYANTSIDVARQMMPEQDFRVGEANQLPFDDNRFDVTLSSSIFHYFPDLEYADQALQEMQRITKPGGQIAILDVPDLAKRAEAEHYRQGQLTVAEYKRLYAEYTHLYYAQSWFQEIAAQLNLEGALANQNLPRYGNAPYRFNAFFTKSI